MGNRLSRIYTRTGDDGSTGLGDGRRVKKNVARVQAMGDVDELNCALGLLRAEQLPSPVSELLLDIQHTLFDLGGELSIPGMTLIQSAEVERLERAIDEYNEDLPALKEFILPDGNRAAAQCHCARALCRRAERTVIDLADTDPANPLAQQFLNRLSDLLFVLARRLARENGGREILWEKDRSGSA